MVLNKKRKQRDKSLKQLDNEHITKCVTMIPFLSNTSDLWFIWKDLQCNLKQLYMYTEFIRAKIFLNNDVEPIFIEIKPKLY